MRKLLLRISAMFLLIYCNNSTGEHVAAPTDSSGKPFELKVKANGFANGYVKLMNFYADQNFMLDSALADAQGNVVFKQDTPVWEGMFFVVFPDQAFVQLLVGKDQQFSIEFSKSDITGTMKVTNSLDNELLYKNLKFEHELQKRFDPVNKQLEALKEGTDEFNKVQKEQDKLVEERKEHVKWLTDNYPDAFFTKFKIAGQNPDLKRPLRPDGTVDKDVQVYYYRNEFWNGVDFSDVRLLRTPVYSNKLKRYIKELTPQIADSIIRYADIVTVKSKANREMFKFTANWIALQYQKTKTMGLEAVYVHMIDRYWTFDQAWWSDSTEIKGLRGDVALMKPSLIGQTGQDIQAKNEFGQLISMYDIKTPVIVLYIFSYHCDNCKKETPKLVKVINEWKGRGVDCFTLCLDDKEDEWKKYLKENNMNFHNVIDFQRESKYHRKYHIDVTPEIYVLDQSRKIIASNINSEQLPAIFERAGLK